MPDNEKLAEYDSPKSWKDSLKYCGLLEPIPPRISFAIRTLRKNHLENLSSGNEAIYSGSIAAIKLIDGVPSLKTSLYFAAASLFPQAFEQIDDDASRALLRILKPGLFASLLGLTYCFKRVSKVFEKPILEDYSQEFFVNAELGYIFGSAFPDLGPADGVLIGGMRWIGLAPFMIKDPDAYTRYRNTRKTEIEIDYEHEKWGCDHAQVAAHVLKKLGYFNSLESVRSGLLGLDNFGLLSRSDQSIAEQEFAHWSPAIEFIDAVKKAKSVKSLVEADEKIGQIVEGAHKVVKEGSSFTWMNRGFSDTDLNTPEKTEQSSDAEVDYSDIELDGVDPEELEQLSPEELEQLKEFSEGAG